MKLKSILIVDDNSVDLEILSIACSSLDCSVDTASCAADALEKYTEKRHTVVLTDYIMQPEDGTDLIARIRQLDPEAQCLLMTGFVDAKANRFAINNHLPPVIRKPIRIVNLVEQMRIALNSDRGATSSLSNLSLSNQMDMCIPLMGQSTEITRVREKVTRLVEAASFVVIEGPVGIGKLDLAGFLHGAGPYADSNLVEFHTRDKDIQTIERELISRDGQLGECVLNAKDGALIIDNIELFPRELQGALAAKFEEIAKTCRLFVLSDVGLDGLFEEGSIDDELFFQLSLVSLYLPPLSERPIDIDAIVRFLTKSDFYDSFGSPLQDDEIDQLIAELQSVQLPGNIGELMERVRQHMALRGS